MGGGDGEVPSVGDGAAEVEAKVVLEGVKRLLVNVELQKNILLFYGHETDIFSFKTL